VRDKIILIEACNFIDYPKGGQLSFCTQLLEVFPDNYFKLIGITTDPSIEIGRWQTKIINGKYYDFFPLLYTKNKTTKGLIPGRLKFFISLLKYQKKLFPNTEFNHLFTHAPETLLALKLNKPNINILHFMHGVENPLSMARFKWAIYFSKLFWKLYLKKLNQADYLAATADQLNIDKFRIENNFNKIIDSFPTRFDDNIFRPFHYKKPEVPTFIYCGRINQVKGWELLIDSFYNYLNYYGEAKLILVGDGEDRKNVEDRIKELGIVDKVILTGFLNKEEIVNYLNKSNVFVLPSYKEGWSIALVEALGCGLPIVSTKVSGTGEMIIEGKNGYVIEERDVEKFSFAMHEAAKLESPNSVSLTISKNYYISSLKEDLLKLYPKFFNTL
jgi:glycosyltransferase involved in cell wall biosynthesis